MPAKVTTKLFLKDLPNKIKKNFSRSLKNEIGDIIIKDILDGKSPVKGKRFKKYSTEYSKLKGRSAPVDLLATGKMLESLRVTQNKIGQVLIEFKSKIAVFHDKTGRVIRRLLPRRGEDFNPRITKQIIKILRKAVKKSL